MTYRWCTVLCTGLLGCGLALGLGDDFNRADGPLGPDWTTVSGTWRIENMRAHSSPSPSTDLVTYNPFTGSDAYVGAEVYYEGGPRIVYEALVSAFANSANNIFVKVQDNSAGGSFNRVFFYYGNNGGGWAGMSGGPAYADVTPFTQARIWTVMTGNSITLNIDRDMNGTPEDILTRGNIPMGGLGQGVGLGGYNNASFDNFVVTPEPAALLLALTALALRRR